MKSTFQTIGAVVVGLAVFVGLCYGSMVLYKDIAPRWQAAEREVFENTPSYVQGKTQTLAKLKLDYENAESDAQKATFKELIATEAVTVDRDQLPANLQAFLLELGL